MSRLSEMTYGPLEDVIEYLESTTDPRELAAAIQNVARYVLALQRGADRMHNQIDNLASITAEE